MRVAPRRTAPVWVALLLLTLGVACSVSSADSERGAITFLNGRDTTNGRQLEALVNEWNKKHPAERVTYRSLAEGTDNERRGLLEAAASPRFDVFGLDVIWVPEFARAGLLRELNRNELHPDQFLPGPWSTVEVDRKTWAVPVNSNAGLLYARTDLLAEIGRPALPTSWSDLVSAARAVQARHPEISGYAGQYDRYEGLVVNVFEAVWATGGDVLSDDGRRIRIGEPASRAGLTRLFDSVRTGLVSPQARRFTEEDGIMAFTEGRLLFMRGWPNAYARLRASTLAGRFEVIPLPGGPSALGGTDLAISKRSRHPATALNFIKFMTSEASQRRLLVNGSLPATRTALYLGPADPGQPYLPTLKAALDGARRRPASEHYAYVSNAIADVIYQEMFQPSANSTQQSVDVVVSTLERRLTEILSR